MGERAKTIPARQSEHGVSSDHGKQAGLFTFCERVGVRVGIGVGMGGAGLQVGGGEIDWLMVLSV